VTHSAGRCAIRAIGSILARSTRHIGHSLERLQRRRPRARAGYIRREVAKRDKAIVKAVAAAIVAEEKARAGEIATLRTTIAELTERLERLEAGTKTIRLAG
jgi:multidrug resistance efflux pump